MKTNSVKGKGICLRTICAALVAATAFAVSCGNNDHSGNGQSNTVSPAREYILVAHRGGIVEDLFSEFDPSSLKAAIDSGYRMLEIDIYPTKDRKLAVHHDRTLARIYGTDRCIPEMTLSEIKELKAIKGGYSPMTFEEVCSLCEGKASIMVDIKADSVERWYCDSIIAAMDRHGLMDSVLFIRNDVRPLFQRGKFGFRISEIPEMQKRIENGENISAHYYLFDHGNRLNAESVKWCQKNNIDVCASVNIGHYKNEDPFEGAERDIEHLKRMGVRIYQIDSDFDCWL